MVYSDHLFFEQLYSFCQEEALFGIRDPIQQESLKAGTDSGWYPVAIRVEFSRTRVP